MQWQRDPVDVLADAHRATITANRVRAEALWGRSCSAYNVYIAPTAAAQVGLSAVQAAVQRVEPGLLVCPPSSLHVSVASLLGVRTDYAASKDGLWAEHGHSWTEQLAALAANVASFDLHYRRLVATDRAVIAVATPSEPVNHLRALIRSRLQLPTPTPRGGNLAHTTLFRYRAPLTCPDRFLSVLRDAEVDVATTVGELRLTREIIYPSLQVDVLAQLSLRVDRNRSETERGRP
jgi:hypothetical protein